MDVHDPRPPALSPELVAFLEGGVFLAVATRDRRLRPAVGPANAVRAHADLDGFTVVLPELEAAAHLANVRDNGHLSLLATRATDARSVQVKGRVLEVRPAGEEDLAAIERHRERMTEQFPVIGVPACFQRRWYRSPSLALELRVSDVFTQTPGPGAGRRLETP